MDAVSSLAAARLSLRGNSGREGGYFREAFALATSLEGKGVCRRGSEGEKQFGKTRNLPQKAASRWMFTI